MLRTLRQIDQVKLVIVDLDDTLWRGVIAEEGIDRPMVTEGWPAGLVEALVTLKKRGVLLAIASKNDEDRIRSFWPHLYGGRLELADFASVKINWQSKAENIAQILKETNLLPRNVVFLDDNPVERARLLTPSRRCASTALRPTHGGGSCSGPRKHRLPMLPKNPRGAPK